MPDLIESLHTAIRSTLISTPEINTLIAPERIRSGNVRAETLPCVLLGNPAIELKGRASGGQMIASVDLVLHVWGAEDDAERTQAIVSAVLQALLDAPSAADLAFDRWQRPQLAWIRDVKAEFLHAVIDLNMTIRWRN